MKYAVVLVLAATMLAFAGGEFSTGGSDLFKFSGYNKFFFGIFGEEDANPASTFSFYNYTSWDPVINDVFSARMSFDTKYGYSSDFTLKLACLWVKMNIIPEISIKGGRFKLPFGYAFYRSGSSLPFYSRAAVSQDDFKAFGGRDIGVRADVNFDPITLNIVYTNGTDGLADTLSNRQITARLLLEPAEWVSLGAAYAMIGESETETTDAWDATGINIFAYANYPVSDNATINFEGEYFVLGYQGPEAEGMENIDGTDYYASLAGTFGVDMGPISALQPALRYEAFDSAEQKAVGAEGSKDAETAIEFCLNMHTGSMNTFQLGARMFGFEDEDIDSYNNIYLSWRLKF